MLEMVTISHQPLVEKEWWSIGCDADEDNGQWWWERNDGPISSDNDVDIDDCDDNKWNNGNDDDDKGRSDED